MDNSDKKKIGFIAGSVLLFLSIRSFLVIDDLLTGIVFLILGFAVLYANEKNWWYWPFYLLYYWGKRMGKNPTYKKNSHPQKI